MVGVGGEYAFADNWSVKLEYNYMDFGRERETLAPAINSAGEFQYDIKQTIQVAKIGVNYRFSMAGR
jgi:outer membrane immunogenic protein